ncbi:MAG: CRR6 family NdhI maturation factor [Scytolyngbya sp. HA4215-MV1]|jgi:hypothetical protein|nr:CRR6 family NdhI maturation factor [Scytolyngbya sp. HA4215-MV1]
MATTIALTTEQIHQLDFSHIHQVIQPWVQARSLLTHEQQLSFQIDYVLEPGDPRELPEIPEIRLWFVGLDAYYPWLPFLLDWKAGELVRYTAMLVPHQFHAKDGIQFNPEALEIFVMHKIFTLTAWMAAQQIEGRSRLKSMAQMFGYELEDELFDLIQ